MTTQLLLIFGGVLFFSEVTQAVQVSPSFHQKQTQTLISKLDTYVSQLTQSPFPLELKKCQIKVMSEKPDQVFKARCGDKLYGIRMFGRTPYAQKRGVHRSLLASELGVGPTVHYVASKIVLWEWLDGDFLQQPVPVDLLQKSADLLRKIHTIPAEKHQFFKKVFIEDRALNRLSELEKKGYTGLDLPLLRRSLTRIQKHLKKKQAHTMIHADLHQTHLLETASGELKLIDWGDSATGDGYDDLAAFSYFFCLTQHQEKKFLTMYLKRTPTSQEVARLYLKKLMVLVHFSLWHLRQGITDASLPSFQKISPLDLPSLQHWICKNGTKTHFSGNPQLSYHLGGKGMKEYFQALQSSDYLAAIMAI